MARIVYLTLLVVAVLGLALGGWAVKGMKKLAGAPKRQSRPRAEPRLAGGASSPAAP
jgi:hypothetical protein